MNEFDEKIVEATGNLLGAIDLDTLQINIGLMCNQACSHCHLEAGPDRLELMNEKTMNRVIDVIPKIGFSIIDITGGAPELHPNLRDLVNRARKMDRHVMVRTNLTVLEEPGMKDLPKFYRDNGVEIIASLPCYLEEEVTEQRGSGVFEKSISALRRLNDLGYGENGLPLNLVYNPLGAFLPPPQTTLEEEYRNVLMEDYGVTFTGLFTITNMPMGRFLADLNRRGLDTEYMELLKKSFNPDTIDSLMCRHQINVGWDGSVCDCDFNRALNVSAGYKVSDIDRDELLRRQISTGIHCFGCAAGSGSSCGGALLQ